MRTNRRLNPVLKDGAKYLAPQFVVGFTLLCAFAVLICFAKGDVDAAGLVRAVRESENWIHNIDTLLVRIESKWTPASAGASSSAHQRATDTAVAPDCNSRAEPDDKCPAPAPKPSQPAQIGPMPAGILEYAIDQARVRFLDEQPQRWRRLRVWDGKQLITHEESFLNNREIYNLNWTTQGSFDELMAYQTSWPRSQPHSFWWDIKDVDGLLCYYGRPEEFVLTGRSTYRGVDCYALEFHPQELRGIVVGQSHRCDSGPANDNEYGYIGEVRGLTDQAYRWYVGTKDRRLYGLVWLVGRKPHVEHWMSDYREVSPGCWLPMTQGYQLYERDDGGEPYLLARRDLKVLEVRVNERLPDGLFKIELKRGVTVVDSRSGRTSRYTYEPEPPQLVGKVLPRFEDIAVELSPEGANNGKTLVCFWDVQQRPSRHCIMKLAEQAEDLARQNVTVVAVQASKVDAKVLNEWLKQYGIPLPVSMVQSDAETIKYSWGVRSLPWLILADRKGVVCAEGFGLDELGSRIAKVIDAERRDLTTAKL